MKLDEALRKYESSVSILKKGYSQEKFRILQIARSFLGALDVDQISSVHIATYRDRRLGEVNSRTGKQLSPATVRLEMSLLSHMFDIARIEWGVCGDNPIDNVRKPKLPPGRDRILTPREERAILRYAYAFKNPDLYSIILLALETAMRQGEILKLEWEHIHLGMGIAHLPETKNGSKRDVPLSRKARDAIIRMGVRQRGRIFGYTAEGLKSTWRLMLIKLGILDLHFHDCRHHAITKLFQLGTLDVMEVAAISGHKSLSMLKRYTHLKTSKLVRKLEGNRHRGRQFLLDSLTPYPATMEVGDTEIVVRLLDFDNVCGRGSTKTLALQAAEDALLRKIMSLVRTSGSIPEADQYLEQVDDGALVMIDPLRN